MTIEEKAKAYDKARKVIKDNLNALNEITETGAEIVNIQSIKNCFYRAFPELKERVDSERIRGAIIDIIKSQKEQQCHIDSTIYDEMIAWLGKQVEPKPFDKVEPKFKVGDCVVNKFGDSWHIVSLDKKNYQVSDEKGNYIYFPISKQDEMRPKYKFIIGDIISNGKVEYRVDNIVKNCIGQDCYFLVNVESEKDGTRYLKLSDSNGKTHNMGEITWLCEQVDAKFEKQYK